MEAVADEVDEDDDDPPSSATGYAGGRGDDSTGRIEAEWEIDNQGERGFFFLKT